MKKLTCLLVFLALFVALGLSNVYAKPAAVDMIFVVDESGSMGGEHAWLKDMVSDLEAALIQEGVGVSEPNRYALVGFGDYNIAAHKHLINGNDWGSASEIITAFDTLVTNGGTEDGYDGINLALTGYSFRPDAAINIVLVTDEDRDVYNSNLNYNNILSLLQSKNALLNAVVNNFFYASDGQTQALGIDGSSAYMADGQGGYIEDQNGYVIGYGSGTTTDDYVNLAIASGGAAWDLNILRAGGNDASSFTAAFIAIKVAEIQQQPTTVPEPTTMLLVSLGLGLAGFVGRRSRRN